MDARINIIADSRQVRTATQDLKRLEREGRATTNVTNQLRTAFVALGGALAVRELRTLADTYTNIQNRIRVVTSSTQELEQVQRRLLEVANESRASLEGTAILYSRLGQATADLGISQERLIGIVDTVNKSLSVSGASAEEAFGALRQLSQGIASGTLRGEEFNSVAEQAPLILRAVAEETGLAFGALREFAAQGGITSELLIRSLENYRDTVEEVFATTSRTFSQAFERAGNNAIEFVGGLDAIQEATKTAGDALVSLSENLDLVVDGATVLATLIGVRLVGSINASVAASLAAVAAQRAEAQAAFFAAQGYNVKTLAVQRVTASTVAFTAASTAARGALALLGGPVGAAIVAAVAVGTFADRAREAREELETQALNDEIQRLVESYRDLNEEQRRNTFTNLVQESVDLNAELQDLNSQIAELESNRPDVSGFGLGGDFSEIQRLRQRALELEERLNENYAKREAIFNDTLPALEESADESERSAEASEKDALAMQKQSAALAERLRIQREIESLRQSALGIGFELGIAGDPALQAEDEYFRRLSVIDNALAQEAITREEARALEIQIEQEYQDELTRIQSEGEQERLNRLEQEANQRAAIFQNQASALGDVFGNFAEIARQGGEESFEAYKTLASAQAIMSAAVAINRALAEGGPFLGPALAVSIGALTAAQIARIDQQQYSPRALGGQVTQGGQYLVGERGPELITMGGNGNVTPYNNLMRAAEQNNTENRNMTANITVNVPESQDGFRNSLAENSDLIYNILARVVRDEGLKLGSRR